MPDDTPSVARPVNGLRALDWQQTEAYWSQLEATLRDVFGRRDAGSVVAAYRRRLAEGGAAMQLHAYHLDPLQVAADLAGRDVLSQAEKVGYARVLDALGRSADRPADASFDYRVPEDAPAGP